MTRFITIHTLFALPLHNLNRDDSGLPKSLTQGGVARGVLSSQSLKRAARMAFEENVAPEFGSDRSSRGWSEKIADRATEIATAAGRELDYKQTKIRADKIVKSLVSNGDSKVEASEDGTETESTVKASSVWLSYEESELIAQQLSEGIDGLPEALGAEGRTGSLAIAAFGRMFASNQSRQTEAALAVSPATMTHRMRYESDYFTTKDDLDSGGASYLDTANYTTGVYYRSVTIDPRQLRRSWTGIDGEKSAELLAGLVRQVILALPNGKINSTNAHTAPLLVLVEEQNARQAYAFETPVAPDATLGGYTGASIARLDQMRSGVLDFDPELITGSYVTGTSVPAEGFEGADRLNLTETVARIVASVLGDK